MEAPRGILQGGRRAMNGAKIRAVQGLVLVLFGATLMLQGCGALLAGGAGAAAGAGTIAYVRGEAQSTYPASFERTWNATLGALQEANLKVQDTDQDGSQGTIKAVQADDKNVNVALEPAGPGTTSVKIRVGTFGDEETSRAIHQRIASRLGVARR
jgi:uncharacterized lipoprotein